MNTTKIASYVAVLASCTAAAVLSALLWFVAFDEPPFDPLGNYPVQSVDEVTLDSVTTTGTKCNDSDQPVGIVGEFNWFRVVPPGFGTVPVNGSTELLPGCTTKTFTNSIPTEVLRVNEPDDLWFITGTEYPIHPSTGELGVPRTWQTENFSIPTTTTVPADG